MADLYFFKNNQGQQFWWSFITVKAVSDIYSERRNEEVWRVETKPIPGLGKFPHKFELPYMTDNKPRAGSEIPCILLQGRPQNEDGKYAHLPYGYFWDLAVWDADPERGEWVDVESLDYEYEGALDRFIPPEGAVTSGPGPARPGPARGPAGGQRRAPAGGNERGVQQPVKKPSPDKPQLGPAEAAKEPSTNEWIGWGLCLKIASNHILGKMDPEVFPPAYMGQSVELIELVNMLYEIWSIGPDKWKPRESDLEKKAKAAVGIEEGEQK